MGPPNPTNGGIIKTLQAIRELGNIPSQIAQLQNMTVGELASTYQELYGEPTRTRNKPYLQKRLAWRIQELAEGGLSPKAIKKVAELGDELPERWRMRLAPRPTITPTRDPRLPPVGAIIVKSHAGKKRQVKVLDRGFEYNGKPFRSLSAIAKAITGTNWNGFAFFGLKQLPNARSEGQ